MKLADVCAVIYGASPDPAFAELVRAVSEQSPVPAAILVPAARLEIAGAVAGPMTPVAAFAPEGDEGWFAAAVRAARSTADETGLPPARWTWLLDGWTLPGPGALRHLLAAAGELSQPAPLLMVSKVLDPDGRLHPDATPRHEIFEKAHSVDAAQRHLVQLRTAAHGSALIDTVAVERFGPPRSDLPVGLDMHEWSARILRRWQDTGYLVPASVAVRRVAPAAHRWRYWLGRARVLGSGGWSATEKLWETFLLGEAAAGALRGRPFRGGRASERRA